VCGLVSILILVEDDPCGFCCGQRMRPTVIVMPSVKHDSVQLFDEADSESGGFLGPFLGCAGRVRITTRPALHRSAAYLLLRRAGGRRR
jgi:hypothetical protein